MLGLPPILAWLAQSDWNLQRLKRVGEAILGAVIVGLICVGSLFFALSMLMWWTDWLLMWFIAVVGLLDLIIRAVREVLT